MTKNTDLGKTIRRALTALGLCFTVSLAWAGQTGTPGLLFSPDAGVVRFDAAAKAGSGEVVVRWTTEMEEGVNAFRVLRRFDDGSTAEVGLVRARGFGEGYAYEVSDPSAQPGDQAEYDLFMISNQGEQQVSAWDGTVEPAPMELPEPVVMAEAVADAEPVPVSERKCWIGNVDRVKVWTNAVPAERIRFSLTEEGIYKVTAREIADAGGWDFESVTNALATTNFAMSCQGEDIAWHPLDDGLIFYGVEPESRWAPENVYWIEPGPGLNMAHIDAPPPENGTTNQWFMDTMFVQGTAYNSRVKFSAVTDERVSYLCFSYLGEGSLGTYSFALPGCLRDAWNGEVTVNLLSLYEVYGLDMDTHTGIVSVGTSTVGAAVWAGEKYMSFTYPFSSTNLSAGTATLKLKNDAVVPLLVDDYSRFLFSSVEFSYLRTYESEEGALRCTGGASNTVAVSGFSTNDVVALDVSTLNEPIIMTSTDLTFDGVSSNWIAAFSCGNTDAVYQVCSSRDGLRSPSVRGVHDVNWADSANAVDYVILIPPAGWVEGFRPPVQELADYRIDQGLETAVVDVESLYNQFSYGLVDPQAIKAFCSYGVSNWVGQPLRYLLLAGDGTVDYKHDLYSVGDFSACLIPTIIDEQRFRGGESMTAAIDTEYGDVNGDGVPEVIVGRLPTPYTNEIAAVVQKTKNYEAALLRGDGVLMKRYSTVVPDWNNIPGSASYYHFDYAVDRLVTPLESAGRILIPCRADPSYPNDLEGVKITSLIPSLKAGTGLFHFFGHSGNDKMGYNTYYNGKPGSYLMRSNDISTNNWTAPTVAVFVGCRLNVWHWPTTSRIITTEGLFAENTGFVAGLAATGFLLTDEGEEMGVLLHDQSEQHGALRLGDMLGATITAAKENTSGTYPHRAGYINRLFCFSLVGDPALVIRHDVTAMGAGVEWLVAHGQTNANADVEDVDGDGWQTWREYQADTNPTGNVLQVVGAGVDTNFGLPVLSFETTSTNTYQVEYKPALTTGDWQTVSWSADGSGWNPAETNIVPAGPVATVLMPESTITTQGFFRVRAVE